MAEDVKPVTVLMPVYNGSPNLREAIDSILNQSFSDFTFLIINDGSTDDSEAIIKEYSDQRIRYVKNEVNIGLVRTLNKGIALCESTYIARMDADDISYPDRLMKQFSYLESHPAADICGCQVQTFGSVNEDWELPVENDAIAARLIFRNALCHPGVMFRKNIFPDSGGIYEHTIPHMEDYLLWWKLKDRSGMYNFPQKLLKYRLEGQNITVRNRSTFLERIKGMTGMILRDLDIAADDKILLLHYFGFEGGYVECNYKSLKLFRQHLFNVRSMALKKGFNEPAISSEVGLRWSRSFPSILKRYGFGKVLLYWWVGKSISRKELKMLLGFYFRRN